MRTPSVHLNKVLTFVFVILAMGLEAARPSNAASENTKHVPLKKVADIPMPGPAVRFDYQSLDSSEGRLYIAHMNADQLVVFDTKKREVVANLDGFSRVHGVWAVPELGRVYASVTGEHKVAAVDMKTLQTLARVGPINYPDGIAYAPGSQRIFVSDEHGNVDAVIDTKTNSLVTSIPHGIALDQSGRLAFVVGEENHMLAVVDLNTMKVLATHPVGEDPDVLAFDPGLKRLYVSAESGDVFVFREDGKTLVYEGDISIPHAHTVCVDPNTHLVYFPLENIDGHPLLRIMEPTTAQ